LSIISLRASLILSNTLLALDSSTTLYILSRTVSACGTSTAEGVIVTGPEYGGRGPGYQRVPVSKGTKCPGGPKSQRSPVPEVPRAPEVGPEVSEIPEVPRVPEVPRCQRSRSPKNQGPVPEVSEYKVPGVPGCLRYQVKYRGGRSRRSQRVPGPGP
jgi:hypothetical protein